MGILEALALVDRGIKVAREIADAVNDVQGALSEDDEAVLKQKLAEYREANEAAFARVDSKLAEAEKR